MAKLLKIELNSMKKIKEPMLKTHWFLFSLQNFRKD